MPFRSFAGVLLAVTIVGCGSSKDDAEPPAHGASGRNSGDAAGSGGSASSTAGTNPGGAANPGGGANATAGTTSGGGASGSGSGGSGPGTNVGITTHDLTVPSGKVFNVADDYFNDGLVPPTPVANFGLHSQITTVANDDGSLDVAWLDYTNGKGHPWSVDMPSMIYVSHVDAALTTATTMPSGVSSYKLLGFTQDATGAQYFAYNKDHSFKTATKGDQNNLSGNELHVTKVSGGSPQWDTLVFGDKDNKLEATLGDPGGAASGVLGYDAMNQKLVVYVGHSMMWDGVRHQAGFLRLLAPTSGALENPAGMDIVHFGAGWWYSHNFNQRLIIDGGNYYVLAHGDAFARQLGFGRWSPTKYASKNDTDFNEAYFKIEGNEGDNNTNAQTGQFTKLADGRFAIVHTSSQGRTARDVHIVLASGSNGKPEGDGAWLTTNEGTTQATMAKVEALGDKLLVTYALWDSKKGHALTWYATVLDASLKTLTEAKATPDVEYVDSAPLFRFKGGPNAGQIGWVSGNAAHGLAVHVAKLE